MRQYQRAVSPVIGIILMVAVTVILSAAVGVFVFDLSESTSGAAQSDVGVQTEYDGEEYTATIITGDADEVSLVVDGEEIDSVSNPSAGATLSASASPDSEVTIVATTEGERAVVTSGTASSGSGSGPTAPTEGLVAYWALDDDDDATTAIDYEGNYNGEISGATYTDDPEHGTVLNYDSRTDVVDVGSVNPEQVTATAWVHWQGPLGTYQHIIVNEEDQYEIAIDENDKLHYAVKADGSTSWSWIDTGYTVTQDTWTHIALVAGNGEVRVYADGTEVTVDSGPTTVKTTSQPLYIGNRQLNDSDYAFSGDLADVRIYDRMLSADEVNEVYEADQP